MKSERIKILWMVVFILLGITVSYAQSPKEKSFDVGKNGQLIVNLNYGDIKIETNDGSKVILKYEEDEDSDYSPFKMIQNGNSVIISSGEDYDNDDITISVPSSINLDLNSDGGAIYIKGNITGKVKCTTAGGDINTKDIDGNADLNTAGGEVTAGNIKGDAAINSGGGDLQRSGQSPEKQNLILGVETLKYTM